MKTDEKSYTHVNFNSNNKHNTGKHQSSDIQSDLHTVFPNGYLKSIFPEALCPCFSGLNTDVYISTQHCDIILLQVIIHSRKDNC